MGKEPTVHRQSNRGFTLLEIILALLVISIGFVALTGLLGSSLDTTAKAHEDLRMVSFSDMVMNYFHASDWSDIPPAGSFKIPDYDGNPAEFYLNTLRQYTNRTIGANGSTGATYTVSYILRADIKESNVKAITLQVWPGFTSNTQEKVFYTEIYNWLKK